MINIQSIINSAIKQAEEHNKKLKDYQIKAVQHMCTNRGMIAAFDVGTGKTLTAVVTAHAILGITEYIHIDFKVIIVTPTSLQENFKKEMRAYGSDPNNKNYVFYTITKFSNLLKDDKINCGGSLIIIDEAHNLRTNYRKLFGNFMVKNNTRAELTIKCISRTSKVLLLTATPVYNRTHDIVNLISMVKGIYPPIDYDPFYAVGTDEFKELFCNRVLFQASSKENFPRRKDSIVKIEMPVDFADTYRELVRKIRGTVKKTRNKSDEEVRNSFMVKLRTASNNLLPCIKCFVAMQIIHRSLKVQNRILVYSAFKKSGVHLIIDQLKKEDIPYFLIDGSTPQKLRQVYVDRFNSGGKKTGNILIITRAGGEGLDLKKVRHVILLEKGWNIAGDEQVIGRAIRYKSHVDLPKKKQTVNVWHLMSVLPEEMEFKVGENDTTYYIRFKENKPYFLKKYKRKTDMTVVLEEENKTKDNLGRDIPVVFTVTKHDNRRYNRDISIYFTGKHSGGRNLQKFRDMLDDYKIKYNITNLTQKTSDSADVYMYLLARKKDKDNKLLLSFMEKIQIGSCLY